MSRRRIKPLRRRGPSRDPKPKIVIVSEGRLTEPDYFYSLARSCGALVSFDVVIEKGAGVPMSVVDKAIELLLRLRKITTYSRRDTVWAVFDRDEHPFFDDAIEKASAAGVQVAFSNPCFEIWLMWHVRDWDGPVQRHALQRALKETLPSYDPDRSKRADFDSLASSIADALRRGKNAARRRAEEGSPRGNPVSTAFDLVEHIQQCGRPGGCA